MNLKQLERMLKDITDKEIQKEIDKLEENLIAIKSERTTVVSLQTFLKVRKAHRNLIAILRKRHGLPLSTETEDSSD